MANQANIKAVITAEDRASGVLQGFSGEVSTLGTKMTGALKAASAAIVATGVAATTFAVKSAADFEQTRIGLENMLGSADKAKVLLSQISKFAADTPFEFPELAQATRQLVAFGFSAEDAFNTMKQLGDVSAAVGAPINDLAYLMGTLRTQGRAFTIDIRQFAQRGIPIYEYLAKVLHTNEKQITAMIEAGKIGFPEVQKAFQAMTSEGGKFHNTMQKQSKSLSGLFSTLKDNIGQTARELVGITQEGDIKPGGPLDKLKNVTTDLINNLPELSKKFTELTKKIGDYLNPKFEALYNTLKDMWPTLKEIGKTFGEALVVAIGLAIDFLNIFLQTIQPVLNWVKDNTWVIWTFVAAIGAIKTAMIIDSAVKSFTAALAIFNGSVAASTTLVGGAGGAATGLRLALLLLTNPWTITLGIVGVGVVVGAIYEIGQAIDKVKTKIDDLNKTPINVGGSNGIKVSGTSDIGLIQQFKNMFGGMRASGGSVTTNKGYIVGENGPEWFMPKTSGTIIPNGGSAGTMATGGNTTINLTVQAGAFMGSDVEARKFAQIIMNHLKDVAGSKNMSLREMMG